MLDKVSKNIAKINLSAVLLIGLVTKVTILGTSIGDSIAIIALCSLQGFYLFQTKDQEGVDDKVKSDLRKLENEVTGIKLALNVKKTHEPQQKKEKRFF